MTSLFWGLRLEPGKRYTSTVVKSFHVSMAALDCTTVKSDNELLSVMIDEGESNVPFILCNLQKNKQFHAPLDLNFMTGDRVTFFCKGSGVVHLSGYIVPDDDDELGQLGDEASDEEGEDEELQLQNIKDKFNGLQKKRKSEDPLKVTQAKKKNLGSKQNLDSDEDDDDDEEDDDEDEDIDSDELEDETMEMEGEDSDEEEEEEGEEESDDDIGNVDKNQTSSSSPPPKPQQQQQQQKKKRKRNKKNKGQQSQQSSPEPNKQQNQQNKQNKQQNTPTVNKQQNPGKHQKTLNGMTPSPQVKKNKKKGENVNPTPNAAMKGDKSKENAATVKKTLEGGVVIKDLKAGNGPVCKSGKMACVYYTGRFKKDNKVFDATTQGAGFKFRVGRGEVIKGWDVGLVGMKVGGKRLITCPPNMAYGQKGSPPTIPGKFYK